MHLTTLFLSLTQPLDTVNWVLKSQRDAMSLLFPFLPSSHLLIPPTHTLSSRSLTSPRHPAMRVGEQFGHCRLLCVHAGVSSSAGQPPDPHHVITLMGPPGRAIFSLSLSLSRSYSHSLSLHWRYDLESPPHPGSLGTQPSTKHSHWATSREYPVSTRRLQTQPSY